MKHLLAICILLSVYSVSSFAQETHMNTLNEMRQKQIENINNPELWDMERMKQDIDNTNTVLPLRDGTFPVPHYNLLGPYRGGGWVSNTFARSVSDYRLMVEDKEVVFSSFFIGNSEFYKEKDRNRVFFTIISVIDTVNTKKAALAPTTFLSRNHPDYGGEGSIITKNDRVDYVTFTTPDKGSFAVVNMRLFHLEYGNIIIVTPQKDGSFRSLQVKSESVNNEEIFEHIKNSVLKQENVVQFLTDEGVI